VLYGPVPHGDGHGVGDRAVEGLLPFDRCKQLPAHAIGKNAVHAVYREHLTSEHVFEGSCGQGFRAVRGDDVSNGISAGFH
jgi:hypothetical protein